MRRPGRVAGIALLGLLAVLAQAGAAGAQAAAVGKLVHLRGAVDILPAQSQAWQPAQAGRFLYPGETVRTGPDGWAALLLADESLIQVNRDSTLLLRQVAATAGWHTAAPVIPAAAAEPPRSQYRLDQGQIWLRNKTSAPAVNLETPTVSASIKGTELVLAVAGDQTTTLSLLEGRLTVWNPAGEVDLAGGEEVLARPGAALVKRVLLSPEDAVQWVIPLPPLVDPRDWPRLEVDRPGPGRVLAEVLALLGQGRLAQARTSLQAGLSLYPQDQTLLVLGAYLDLLAGRHQEARVVLTALPPGHPAESLATSLLALSELLLGRKVEARAAVGRALAARPSRPLPWLVKAYVDQASFDLDAAVAATRRGLELDPAHVPSLINLAKLLFGREETQAALEAVEKARRLAPQEPEVANVEGFVLLARRRTEAAEAAFREAARLGPGLAEPRLGLALVKMRQGRTAEAVEEISTAVLLEPRRALLVAYWGKFLYQLRRFPQALDVLEMAARLDPQDPTPRLYQAFILRDLNRPTEAVASLNQAMALNDHRAVYRSRLLLDQDLAVKNVALSLLYDQLGLDSWALTKATASLKQDYFNSSAHLFLSGALANLEGRDRAAESEALLARLLQPANLNSFNAFNDYTSFLERPGLSGTLTGAAGNLGTFGGRLALSGALPQADLAFGASGDYLQTDGWRRVNSERDRAAEAQVKWDPTPEHSLMLAASHTWGKLEDKFYPRYEYDAPGERFDWLQAGDYRLELGYRWRLSPAADLLVVLTRSQADGDSDQRLRQPLDSDFGPAMADVYRHASVWEPYWQGQAQFQARWGEHRLILGTNHYWGSQRVKSREDVYLDLGDGQPFYLGRFDSDLDLPKKTQTYYVHDSWRIHPSLTVEGALYLDQMEAGNAFYGTTWRLTEVSPRLGLAWRATPRDTLRLAVFRYLLPFYASRIDPQDVAGVTIFRNHMDGSLAWEGDIVWEHEWSGGGFIANLFHVRREYSYKFRTLVEDVKVTERGRLSGGEVTVNQVLAHGLGLFGGYRYLDVSDEGLPEAERREHQASLGLRYVHPSGLTAAVKQTLRHEELKSGRLPNQVIGLTDLKVGYLFPHKRGSINLEVRNLFDQRFNWVTDFFVTTGRAPAREILLTGSINF